MCVIAGADNGGFLRQTFFLSPACELIMQSYLPGRSPDSTRDQVDSRDFSTFVP